MSHGFDGKVNATKLYSHATGRGFHRFTSNAFEFHYSIPPDVHPFTGWGYKAIKKNGCHAASLPKMYTRYLTQILKNCLGKLSSDQVKFHFILCQGRNEVYGTRDQRPLFRWDQGSQPWDLGSQPVGSGSAVFSWNQGSVCPSYRDF